MLVPASTLPWRWMAPVRARIASSKVVLPLWNGPTSAIHRGPLALPPFSPITASHATGRPAETGSWAFADYRFRPRLRWQEAAAERRNGPVVWLRPVVYRLRRETVRLLGLRNRWALEASEGGL